MDDRLASPDMSAPPPTIAAALRARAEDSSARVFLRAGEARWTFAETYREACRYANLFLARSRVAARREAFLVDRVEDPIYWRPRGAAQFTRFTLDDLAAMRERFQRAGYGDRLES